jgi:AcrR family transcriptional regulator
VGERAHPQGEDNVDTTLDEAATRRIIEAATEVLAAEGPTRATIKWVAREARVDPSVVAARWPTMEDLMATVLDDLAVRIETQAHFRYRDLPQVDEEVDAEWTRLLALFSRLVGRSLLDGVNPAELQAHYPLVDRMVKGGVDMGMDERTARYRTYECYVIEWGWRLFGPHLAIACGLDDESAEDIRTEITRLQWGLRDLPPVPPPPEP